MHRTPPDHRLARSQAPSLSHQITPDRAPFEFEANVVIPCGWGRLIMAHTFRDPQDVARALDEEVRGCRDIAFYVRAPHVVLAKSPHTLVLAPSPPVRLWLANYKPAETPHRGFAVRRLQHEQDAAAINRIYRQRRMVAIEPDFIWDQRVSRNLIYAVVEDLTTHEVVGTATGVDHVHAFDDPERGSSLWCLAVDPQTRLPGIGEALVRYLAEQFQARGREFMDLSVLYDNRHAIALYEKLGFQRVPVFTVKRKNAINETLYSGPGLEDDLNPYARLITHEARKRGIAVEVLDADNGYFQLSWGWRVVKCRESLTDLTTAVAMSRCQDKHVTHRVLRLAGLKVPDQAFAADEDENNAFLAHHGAVVVKPADGEQGRGISVDVRDPEHLSEAIEAASRFDTHVLLEQFCPGDDLRIIVIGFEVVAAAVRRPAQITGDGRHTVRELIEKQSRRRAAATGGESKIPLDAETERCVSQAGFAMDEVLPYARHVQVRKTANLHTGGTIHDVTAKLHPALAEAAIRAAQALDIPVVGLDMIVKSIQGPGYVIIEANERPGLANHEPQPTAERFIDLLFPQTSTPVPHAQA
ncbi:MAG: N-acetylglutaminylglutamine synthetase [Candidatus Competibacterales bacterium]